MSIPKLTEQMPKLLQINSVVNVGSTGRIAEEIGGFVSERGWESAIAYGRSARQSSSELIRIGSKADLYANVLKARLLDNDGFNARRQTEALVEVIGRMSPDVVHLHNLHGYYINVDVLFSFLRKSGVPVVWTLHDCWPFTGHCAYFDAVGCLKWRDGCGRCPQKSSYPASWFLNGSARNCARKKSLFSGMPRLSFVPVSKYVEGLLKDSFLKGSKSEVIYNGVDTRKFYPSKKPSGVREKYSLGSGRIVLGVANIWDARKGLKDLVELSYGGEFKVVLVGLTPAQIRGLPENVMGIERTDSVDELRDLYSAADVFANPTYEEAFGMVNIEALACGTPVVTYKTGGSPECVDGATGIVVEKGNVGAMRKAVLDMMSRTGPELSAACVARVKGLFTKEVCCENYLRVYEKLLSRR